MSTFCVRILSLAVCISHLSDIVIDMRLFSFHFEMLTGIQADDFPSFVLAGVARRQAIDLTFCLVSVRSIAALMVSELYLPFFA